MTAEVTVLDPETERELLLAKFDDAQRDLKESQRYYDADPRQEAVGLPVPLKYRDQTCHVGYPRMYIDSLAERQQLEGFRVGGKEDADKELWEWWERNDLDIYAPLGAVDAMIYGRSYITISMPIPDVDLNIDPEVPLIRVEPPTSLWADVDPRTRQVRKAIRVIVNDEGDQIQTTVYLPDQTVIWDKDDQGNWAAPTTVPHGLGQVPVVLLPNPTRSSDIYGSSEITPELRSMTDAASQVLQNMRSAANTMATPQRLLFGAKPEELGIDPENGKRLFDAYMANIIAFEDSDAKAQQFSAAELRNFTDALQEIAKQVASYTGLPPQYLSYSSENPASAEAIRASEARLVMKVERKNRIFGGAWETAMRIAYRVAKGSEIPTEYYRMETVWRDPSTPTYAAKADATTKLFGNGRGVIPKEQARIDMGYTFTARENMREWDKQDQAAGLGMIDTMYGPGGRSNPKQEKPPPEETAA